MKEILLLGFGGFIGTTARYTVQFLFNKYLMLSFPLGTLVVNISGCFAIGLLYGMAVKYTWMTGAYRLFLITGICGGYTTFSTFSYESLELFRQGNYTYFLVYVLLSVIIGLLATALGVYLAK